jgi:hypothetical protein
MPLAPLQVDIARDALSRYAIGLDRCCREARFIEPLPPEVEEAWLVLDEWRKQDNDTRREIRIAVSAKLEELQASLIFAEDDGDYLDIGALKEELRVLLPVTIRPEFEEIFESSH